MQGFLRKLIYGSEINNFLLKNFVANLEWYTLEDGVISIIWFLLFWKIIFKMLLFESRMKLDIDQFHLFSKSHDIWFEDIYRKNGIQLAQEAREIWMDEIQRPKFIGCQNSSDLGMIKGSCLNAHNLLQIQKFFKDAMRSNILNLMYESLLYIMNFTFYPYD